MESWKKHYKHLEGKAMPPAATLNKALQLFAQEQHPVQKGHAIDLGCGNGIDTIAMLENGWQVLAIDKQQEALSQLNSSMPAELNNALTTQCTSFENLTELPQSALVNATFSLPFCKPDSFDLLWQIISNCLLPEGRFAGHFFGKEDSWATNTNMTFHTAEAVKKLFPNFTLEAFQEVNKQGKTVSGQEKHWHVFHVVAKRNPV